MHDIEEAQMLLQRLEHAIEAVHEVVPKSTGFLYYIGGRLNIGMPCAYTKDWTLKLSMHTMPWLPKRPAQKPRPLRLPEGCQSAC